VSVTVGQLAEWVRGEVLGDPDLPIANARAVHVAHPGDITFVDGERYASLWQNCKASAAVVALGVPFNGRTIIRVADPLMAFACIVQRLRGRPADQTHSIHPTAVIHPTASLGAGVSIGPHAVVGEESEIGTNATLHAGVVVGRGCRIGNDTILKPHVVVYDECVLGNRVVVHANAVIGADGFGYRLENGKHVKVPQLGWVEIEDDVEIGACSTIDRGTFGPTCIGAGTKIDNLVMIAHNCQIGRHNLLAGQVGIAGSSTTGEHVVMAGQAGAVDHVEIGDHAVIGARAAILGDISDHSRVLGYPAGPEGPIKRAWVLFERLPDMYKALRLINRHLGLGGTDIEPVQPRGL